MFADLTLARRLENADASVAADCARAYAQRHPDSGPTVRTFAGGQAIYAGPESPVSQAIAIGMNGPVSADQLDILEEFYRSNNTPVNIELCPHADATLTRALSDRPYRLTGQSNVLYQPIHRGDHPPSHDRALQVHRVSPDNAATWANVSARGFVGSDAPPADIVDLIETTARSESATCLLVTIDGTPAGGGSVAIHDRVAVLFGQSTLRSHRNRGVQSAVIAASLDLAMTAYCDLAMICTHPGTTSQHNAERAAFRVAYTRAKLTRFC